MVFITAMAFRKPETQPVAHKYLIVDTTKDSVGYSIYVLRGTVPQFQALVDYLLSPPDVTPRRRDMMVEWIFGDKTKGITGAIVPDSSSKYIIGREGTNGTIKPKK